MTAALAHHDGGGVVHHLEQHVHLAHERRHLRVLVLHSVVQTPHLAPNRLALLLRLGQPALHALVRPGQAAPHLTFQGKVRGHLPKGIVLRQTSLLRRV